MKSRCLGRFLACLFALAAAGLRAQPQAASPPEAPAESRAVLQGDPLAAKQASMQSVYAYTATRFADIRLEAALGAGENLNALADLLDIADKPAFGRWMRTHYPSIFHDLPSPGALSARIRELGGDDI